MRKEQRIYLDNNATTRPDPNMLNSFKELIKTDDALLWANPSSIYQDSRGTKMLLREARRTLASILNCSPLEIIFNSGASEGNNTVFKSVWTELGSQKNEFIVSAVEHPSVAKTAEYLQTLGAVVHWVPVSREGQLDIDFIKNKISDKTALVSVMYANNETGVVFPIAEITSLAKMHDVLVHVDCVQALGKLAIDLKKLDIDYATFSAHKFYAFKGSGALYVKKGVPYVNLVHGGGQERHRRGGTENTVGLWAFNFVVSKYLNQAVEKSEQMRKIRDHFEAVLIKNLQDVSVTAQNVQRLPNTSSLVLGGIDGETLLMSLDLKGFSVSTGAACSSGSPEPSPVLLAMGLSREEAQSSLRVSLGWQNTLKDVDLFLEVLISEVNRLRQIQKSSTEAGVL